MLGDYVAKPSNGWYQQVNQETGELIDPKVREKDTLNEDFWKEILNKTNFKEYINKHYSIVRSDAVS